MNTPPAITAIFQRAFSLYKNACLASAAAALCIGVAPPVHAELKAFELEAPTAKQVYLAGEMTNWDTGKLVMKKDATGKWKTTVDLGVGEWLYKFVVDGQWISDPGTTLHDNDGQGGQHSFVFVGDGAWAEHPGVAQGKVETLLLPSTAWGKPVKLNVYLPPGFTQGQPYPVLLLLHGSGMDADQWLKTGMINRYMDNLLASKTIQPFVIVMPSSEKITYIDQSERFITQELPVWLHKTYGLTPGPHAFAVAGMSMGGFGAFHLPSKHPDLFGFGFALSGFYPKAYVHTLPKRNPLPFKLMLLCGSEDPFLSSNQDMASALKAQGASFYYRENKGGHTFQYWSNRTEDMLSSVNAFFVGDALAHNENELNLPQSEIASNTAIPIIGKEITPSPELAPQMLGLWRGEWEIPGGIKGGYEEVITEIGADYTKGTFSVLDAGPETKIDEPFTVKTYSENGRGHYINPVDGSDVISILSQNDKQLWRQWAIVNNNGMKILLRVMKIDDEKRP